MREAQFLIAAVLFIASATGGSVDPKLQKRFIDFGGDNGGGEGGGTQNIMVSFTSSVSSVFEKINAMNFSSDGEKRTAQVNAQEAFVAQAQAPLKAFLEGQGVQSESFWINNKMIIDGASPQLASAIASFPGVDKVEEEPVMKIETPVYEELNRTARQNGNIAWGVSKIRAPDVWNQNIGGWRVVVANIDTGVRYTHEALKSRWRSSYGWFDPYSGTSSPNDNQGHGTHVMGTIAGEKGVGIAPEASWISCKGCGDNGCGGRELLKCAEWITCPTTPSGGSKDCNRAPNVVANSWGGPNQGNTWFDDAIKSWRNAGIIPVFAIGNEGPDCESTGNPGDRPNLISVGNTDSNDRIASSSSLGPAYDGRTIKPEVSAPGSRISSAYIRSDTDYASLTGTSMACPHVAGVVALMLEKNRGLTYDQIFQAITRNTITNMNTQGAKTCGGISPSRYPNNVFGYGRIDALNAVNAV